MTPDKSVDCVILNWKDTPRTVRCIESLSTISSVSRIIVVDNEADGLLAATLEQQSFPNVELVQHAENRGFAAGVNPGLRIALAGTARAILCINNDAYLKPGALDLLLAGLTAFENVGMVAPLVTDPEGRTLSTGGTFRPLTSSTTDIATGRLSYLTWACVLLDREMLLKVGELDESFFMYWEDVDFGLRMSQAGYEMRVIHDSVAVHEVSSSHERAGARILMYSTLGLVVLARKLGGVARIGATYRVLGRLASAVMRGDVAAGRAVVRGARLGLRVQDPAWKFLEGQTR